MNYFPALMTIKHYDCYVLRMKQLEVGKFSCELGVLLYVSLLAGTESFCTYRIMPILVGIPKLAAFCRPRLLIQPVCFYSRIQASTSGYPVMPSFQISNLLSSSFSRSFRDFFLLIPENLKIEVPYL